MLFGAKSKINGGRVMRLLVAGISVLSAVAILEPAVAAEIPATPKRERVAERPAPQRPAPRPAPTQGANWTGGQLGGSNGVSSVNNSFVDPGSFICPPGSSFSSNCFETPFSFSGHRTVYTIGPFVGYRWLVGKGPYAGAVVFGIEGDWSWKNAESSLNQATATPMFASGSNFLRTDQFFGSVKQKSDSSIRARLGTLITPWTLVYVTSGVAIGEFSGTFAYTGTLFSCSFSSSCTSLAGTATTAASWNETRVGGTVGVGWETEIFPGWKARAEYRYTDFGTLTQHFPLSTSCSSCGAPSSNVSIDMRESFHTFRVGLGFDL